MTQKKNLPAPARTSSAAAATPALTPPQQRFAAVLGSFLADRWSAGAAAPGADTPPTSTGSLTSPAIKT